jgi:aspartate racemase
MHIGLVGGIGPAATEFYYRGLVARHAASQTALNLTIDHADVRELAKNQAGGDAKRQADLFVTHLQRLAAAGADAAAVTSLAGHFCIRELEAMSPLRLINALPAIDAAIANKGLRRVGILGTRRVMESGLYGGISSAEIVLPQGDDLQIVHDNYMRMATDGKVTEEQRQRFFSIGRRLVAEGDAEAVLLAGTDLFLAFDGFDPGFPTLDCADIHIEAIYRASFAARPASAD